MEVKEITIITTPLKQLIELNYYDLYDFLRKDGNFFIESEYKKEGISDYYFTLTNELKELVERYYTNKNFMVRYNQIYYPKFHDDTWRITNKFVVARLNRD